ncbi:MAG TPA: L,D-transpeptidase family protein [Rhodopila sp.]|jgi:L,D-peptidoglycan transpeptidase YkuD (ErfK/YbiS/YcfS/YnhG family)|nr:L,D-transpeptidase family protein [Rhodopila sp.]
MRAIVTANGTLTIQNETFRAALGRGGVRADKQEGDGATPVGVLPLRNVLYRPDRGTAPASAVPVRPLAPDDGWCDAASDPAYNKPVRLPYPASAEALWRDDTVYDIIGILGWNDSPIRPNRGSAIFLHIARPDYAPTDGCVALAQDHLRRVLAMGLTELVVRPA